MGARMIGRGLGEGIQREARSSFKSSVINPAFCVRESHR